MFGGKESIQDLARLYTSEGYISVAINMHNIYINPETQRAETTVFEMLNDIYNSVRKLKELSDERKWDLTQMATYGGSAGGILALIYAYFRGRDMSYFDTQEVLPVKFVLNLVGPVDMTFSLGPEYAVILTGASNNPDLTEEEKAKHIHAMFTVYYADTYGGVLTVMGYAKRDPSVNPNGGKVLKVI